MPFTIEQIREALSRHQPTLVAREPDHAEAAVALVLAGTGNDLSLCAIRRAEHPLDPWSGHMALPGGRASAEDSGPRAVAERETLEEVGLALGENHWIGPLSHVLVRLGVVRGHDVASISTLTRLPVTTSTDLQGGHLTLTGVENTASDATKDTR